MACAPTRCLDGHVNGRLARCPTCFKGKLNVNEADAGSTVLCKGYYDEDMSARMPCSYKADAAAVPRLTPWHVHEPTEEEVAAMKAVTERHEALLDGGGSSDVPPALAAAAAALQPRWDPADRKQCAQALVDLCGTTVHLPQDEKKARMAVGKLLLAHPAATCEEMLAIVVKEFGVSSAKEEVQARQRDALANSCAVAANAGIVQAFKELGDFYFKDGNANVGAVVRSAVARRTHQRMVGAALFLLTPSLFRVPFPVYSTRRRLPASLPSTMKLPRKMPKGFARVRPKWLA